MPYAIISALMAAIGYIVLELTGNVILTVIATILCTIIFSLWMKRFTVKGNISQMVSYRE
jgi:uncharacterized membrane protein